MLPNNDFYYSENIKDIIYNILKMILHIEDLSKYEDLENTIYRL